MEKINQILNYISIQSYDIWQYIVMLFGQTTGLSTDISQDILIVIFIYIIAIFLLIKFHKKLYRSYIQNKTKLTMEYDKIIYLIAQQEYEKQIPNTHNPINQILTDKSKDYLHHHQTIINSIRDLEIQTNEILLNPETEKQINKLIKKTKNLNIIQKLFKFIISILTLGLYILF